MKEYEKIDLILSEVQGMKVEMREMKEDMQGMKAELREVKEDVQVLKEDVQNLKDGMQTVNREITGIHLILENEIRVNIQRVAEGHLDLSRNFHEAMKPNSEVETLSIKVHKLESDMKMVKAKIGCA